MGFRISWIGLRDVEAPEALARAGLRDTGELEEVNESPASWALLPDSWLILFCNDFNFASDELLQSISSAGPILSAQIHEGIMYSGTRYHDRGEEQWSVSYFSENGIFDVEVSGRPPLVLDEIRNGLIAKQREAGKHCGVDYVFDVPVQLAEAICGYRYDRWQYEWGRPIFKRAEPLD